MHGRVDRAAVGYESVAAPGGTLALPPVGATEVRGGTTRELLVEAVLGVADWGAADASRIEEDTFEFKPPSLMSRNVSSPASACAPGREWQSMRPLGTRGRPLHLLELVLLPWALPSGDGRYTPGKRRK